MEQRVSFITLAVADLAISEAFYRALGWTPSSASVAGEIVFFQLNGVVFGLFGRQALADDAGVPNTLPGGFSGVTLSHNVRTEGEVDATLRTAIAAGATVTKAPHRASFGGIVAYFTDPDGHLWEVCFNPQALIAEDGAVRFGELK